MSSYAIIETGSKQYRVEPKSIIEVERLKLPEGGKEVLLEKVLLLSNGKDIQVGNPLVKGASVICELLEEFRAPKVVSFRFRRRKNSRRKRGHRQDLFRLQVKEIKAAK